MPIYNAEPYLAKCIDSLIHQSHTALQIVLVNDGSTDDSLAIAEQYAEQDNRIELYSLDTNKGQSVARNMGLQHAVGEFISFVDADDYVDADFYSTLITAIGNYDCVQIGYRRVTPEGEIKEQKLPRHFYQFTSPCMRLYRCHLFEQRKLSFATGIIYEDVLFSLEMWKNQPTYTMLSYMGYNYTINPSSTTAIRNIAAENKLFALLHKIKQKQNLRYKLLVLYTIIRLKIHFIRHD